MREGGLEVRAKELDDEAAAIRKKEGQALPPGRRLDSAAAYADRAAARAVKARDAVAAAEAALAEAMKAHDAACRQSEEATATLAALRAELAANASGPPGAVRELEKVAMASDESAVQTGQAASEALARARSHVEAGAGPLTLEVFQLSRGLGEAVFNVRTAPDLTTVLDQPTLFFLQDALQVRVRDGALAEARKATRAPAVSTGPAADAQGA